MSTGTQVLDAPAVEKPKRKTVKEMNEQEKAAYYAVLKEKREARKANKFSPPAGAPYVNEQGKYTFTQDPEGYDMRKQAPFVESDFASEDIWLDYKAGTLEKRAAELRKEAEQVRTGGPRLRGDAKKLVKLQEKFEALRASLTAEGIDVESILASMVKPAQNGAQAVQQ